MKKTVVKSIDFLAGTEKVSGHLYLPKEETKNGAALLFTGPYTGVKEQVTGHYARLLAERGFTTLAFDHRNFGQSDGQIRQHEDPHAKLADLQAATAFLSRVEGVDPSRIGAVGICLGGSYALRFAAFDPRIKALATVGAAYLGVEPMDAEQIHARTQWLSTFSEELNRLPSGQPQTIAAVTDTPNVDAGMPGREPFEYYGTERSYSPHWVNEITRLSSYNLACFDSAGAIPWLGQTPTLIVHGTTDAFCSPENAQRAYDLISAKKKLAWIETTNHIELYDSERHVSEAIDELQAWMTQHLV